MSDSGTEQAERRAIRRRWINIGELVAVAGLIIAALSLYLGWSGRREDEAARRADQAQQQVKQRHIGLVATRAGGDVLTFKGVACTPQSTDISFPSALAVAPQNMTFNPRIEADWFAKPLATAAEAAKSSEGRLPILIESRCPADDGDRIERAIYDVPYRIDSRFLRGHAIHLQGLVLREYVSAANGQKRLDAAWRRLAPAKPAAK
jgi:hypothetical protein